MHIHIVAVSGTAMASLAGLLVRQGHTVSGSDSAFDPPMGPQLAKWGVRCLPGFSPSNLTPRPDLVVIGNVCRRDNPEAVAAHELGLPITHVAGALARFVLQGAQPLVVAGTHGKTTTTSLCAWLLHETGFHPGFLVGGIPRNFGRSFASPSQEPRRLPVADAAHSRAKPNIFVIEGDEYDTAYFEKTPKFIHYQPFVAILTSIEHDHIDIYPTFDDYLAAFGRFIALVPARGLIVANASDPEVVKLVEQRAKCRVSYFALEGATTHQSPHWCAAPGAVTEAGTQFDLFAGGVRVGRFLCPLPGRHNLSNALAALAACAEGYGARIADLMAPLTRFEGVERRQQRLATQRGTVVYDDFAHHPTAVHETLRALRERHPHARLTAVFEARSATACRRLHQQQYASSFAAADEIALAPLGRSLPDAEQLDRDALVGALRDQGKQAAAFESVDAILEQLSSSARPDDVIVLLSNGTLGGLRDRLQQALR
ncbi:MAG TPA: Mur ligase family protein [Polyangiaceae bacterium]|nr:Mur ligase family protein [Polyangiaceae bacterium]